MHRNRCWRSNGMMAICRHGDTAGHNHGRGRGQCPAMVPHGCDRKTPVPGQVRCRGDARENPLLQTISRLNGRKRRKRSINLLRVVDACTDGGIR